MQVKKVVFRLLIGRPIVADLRKNPELQEKYGADALVLCMWIDQNGFIQAESVAGMSLRAQPEIIDWNQFEVPFERIENCEALLRVRPDKAMQRKVWEIRSQILEDRQITKHLNAIRKTEYLDDFRVPGRPDLVVAHAESEYGCMTLVQTEKFDGTQLLGTVKRADENGLLHNGDQVMLYDIESARAFERVLVATKSIYK